MQHVWLIRAGVEAEYIDPMRQAGIIALRDDEFGDALAELVVPLDQTPGEPADAVAATMGTELKSFLNEVKQGDIVVTPNPKRHEVWLSLVAGEYLYDPNPAIDGYRHTRPVTWLGWLDRDARWMVEQSKAIDQPVALIELYNREWWWKQLDSTELTTVARATWAPERPARQRSTTPSTRKPKLVVPVKPKVTPMVLCAGRCGLQWNPPILVNGLCPDCRGD
ncbi:unannotated protein [freshwater metagenome]|uniref:Unannotated protein n=1 Tax=freshwater metagenome TaxID=449393 RepID=A0A6J7D2G1_9ZZZZ|nr:hypothetical protein [Actinomycetota bacterium]